MKFSIKDFFYKFDQIRRILRVWLTLLMKSLMENLIFYAASWKYETERRYSLVSSVRSENKKSAIAQEDGTKSAIEFSIEVLLYLI